VNGFDIVLHKGDHPPPHIHVYKDGRYIGKFDPERHEWMKGPADAEDQARKAVAKWLAIVRGAGI
jgi:hypothetical protein